MRRARGPYRTGRASRLWGIASFGVALIAFTSGCAVRVVAAGDIGGSADEDRPVADQIIRLNPASS